MDELYLQFESDIGVISIRDFLCALLMKLWKENESFNSKRPWGNSDWQNACYAALIKSGHLKGKLDEDGFIEDFNKKKSQEYMMDIIKKIFENEL